MEINPDERREIVVKAVNDEINHNKRIYDVLLEDDKTSMYITVWQGEEDMPYIVFLPGIMANPYTYKEFLNPLSRMGYNIVGVHYRMHGISERKPELECFTFQDLVYDVNFAIEWTKNNLSNEIILMGHSLGGIIAANVASERNDLKAVISHSLTINELDETTKIIKMPEFLVKYTSAAKQWLKTIGKVMPNKKVSLNEVLSIRKILGENEDEQKKMKIDEYREMDAVRIEEYPMSFISTLFTLDTTYLTENKILTDFYIAAPFEDQIFSFEYMQEVFDNVKAPNKYFVPLACDNHMSLTEYPIYTLTIFTEIFDKYKD